MAEQPVHVHTQLSAPPPGLERRAKVRYTTSQETSCHPVAAGWDDSWWQATVRDISGGGIRLSVTRLFEPGTLLALDLDGLLRLLVARVVHVAPQPEGWLVGCEFISKLSEQELQVLL
jgi:hypothetical protein